MSGPQLLDRIHFEDDITAIATSPEGDFIAVGTVGMLGLYQVLIEGDAAGSLVHIASFSAAGTEVVDLAFSNDGKEIYMKTGDGLRRTLATDKRAQGMLVEIKSEAVGAEEPAYPLAANAS